MIFDKSRNRVRGYVLSPDRRITQTPLELIGRVLWGGGDERGTPAWVAPKTMRLVDKRPSVLLTTTSLAPVAGPEEPPVETPGSLITRIFSERQATLAGTESTKRHGVNIINVIAFGFGVMNVIAFLVLFYGRFADFVGGFAGGG